MDISYPVNVWILEILSIHGCMQKKDILQQMISLISFTTML